MFFLLQVRKDPLGHRNIDKLDIKELQLIKRYPYKSKKTKHRMGEDIFNTYVKNSY